MKRMVVVLLLLSGCSIFGRHTYVHTRMPIIPEPEVPVLKPDDGSVETMKQNFAQVATFAVRLLRGVREYNRIAAEHNAKQTE